MQLKKRYSHRLSHLALIVSALAVGGCSSGGDDAVTTTTTTTTSTAGVAGLKTVEQIDVVAADDSSATTYKLPRNFSKLGRAFNDAATDYTTDEQHFHVWHPALEPVESVNSILCFIGQVKAQEFVNDGPFIALVDESKCEKGGGDSGSTQGSQSSSSKDSLPSYVEVVADATRTSSTSPMEVKIWIPEMGMGEDASGLIKAKITVNESPSESKPFGDFRLAFDMSAEGTPMGGGDLASQTSGSQTGFTFYESEGDGSGDSSTKSASLLGSADGTTGVAMTRLQRSGGMMGGGDGGGTFGLSFNEDNVLGRKGATAAAIQTDTGGACLSRTEFDEAVWRYNLYHQATGERVTLNSGFPFKYTEEGEERFGYVGYWGVWSEGGHGLADGTTITKQTFSEGGAAETDTYTIQNTPGKLIKHTVKKLDLTKLVGVQFQYWNSDLYDEMANPNRYDQWIVEYSASKFQIIGGIKWSPNGPPTKQDVTPVDIHPAEGETLNLWSQQLGGNVLFKGGDMDIVYNSEEVMSKLDADVYFTCIEKCTRADLTAEDDLTSWTEPYTNPRQGRDSFMDPIAPVAYRFDASEMTLYKITGPSSEVAVEYPEVEEAQGWGIRSGHLFIATDASTAGAALNNMQAQSLYDLEEGMSFYEWEMGPHNWNKLTRVINTATSEVAAFDKPIEFSYTHETDNDRAGSDDFDGQRFLLSYQGDGQLHGIPFEAKVKDKEGKDRGEDEAIDENNHHVRWYPQFNLKDGITLGASGQYVVKAIDIEQMMQEESVGSVCDSLDGNFDNLGSLPSGLAATHDTDISSVGEIPELTGTDAIPKVVGGEVQVEDEE